MVKLSANEHLSKEDIIKNGSIFTPDYIVDLVDSMIADKIDNNTVLIDFGAGYGAFISKFLNSKANKFVATDFDHLSFQFLKEHYPSVNVLEENSISNVLRSKYATQNEKIIVIGNPPYNDVTSQYKKGEKGSTEIDTDIYARDLGISFLKMYDKIGAEYVCVLHPLSYLCKKSNFNSLGMFSVNYTLKKAVIFSSHHFETIKKANAEFPVVAALYKRETSFMSFDFIKDFEFDIFGSDKKYKINSLKTIDGIVNKYPTKDKKDSDLQFYTIRDINALHRNKSFLIGHCNNGIKVTKDNLHYYAWLDLFKNYFNPKNDAYLYGNLSPLISSKINETNFKNKLYAYILNNNKIVNDFYKKQDPEFYNKFLNFDYSLEELSNEVNSLIN